MQTLTSNQPYLLKAFFDWILDNQLTPYLVVNAELPGVNVPTQFVKDGQIVLNVSPSACVNFHMDLDNISFQARFSGQPMLVTLPCLAVGAIYAKENGAGTVFADAEELQQAYLEAHEAENPPSTDPSKPIAKSPLESVDGGTDNKASDADVTKSKRPSLKVVK